jgi:hypothetical protein
MGFYYETVFLKNGKNTEAGLPLWMRNAAGWKEHKMFLRGGDHAGLYNSGKDPGSLILVIFFGHGSIFLFYTQSESEDTVICASGSCTKGADGVVGIGQYNFSIWLG